MGIHPAAPVDDDHAGKTHRTAQDLGTGQFVIAVDEVGQNDGQKSFRSVEDRAFHTCGVGQADVEKHIFQRRLHESQQEDRRERLPARQDLPFVGEERDRQHQKPRQRKAAARKKQLPPDVIIGNVEQVIADLHAGISTSP